MKNKSLNDEAAFQTYQEQFMSIVFIMKDSNTYKSYFSKTSRTRLTNDWNSIGVRIFLVKVVETTGKYTTGSTEVVRYRADYVTTVCFC